MSQRCARLILTVHAASSICHSVSFLNYFVHKKFQLYGFMTNANVGIKYFGLIAVHWIICLESYCSRPVQRRFWHIYREIESSSKWLDRNTVRDSYVIKFAVFFIVSIGISINHFTVLATTTLNMKSDLPKSISITFLIMVHEMQCFYFLFFVYLLDDQLHKVGTNLKALANDSENGSVSCDRLRRIRIHYDLTYELSNCMNEAFGWSNFVNVLYIVMRLAADLNWMYSKIHNHVGVQKERKFCSNADIGSKIISSIQMMFQILCPQSK